MFSKRKLLLSITGRTKKDWQNKLNECEKLGIKRVALFLEIYSKKQRQEIYSALLNSNIKKIPFVHARNDMDLEEFKFLIKKFKTKYFNLHENSFKYLDKWKGIHKKLLLEMNYDNKIPANVKLNKINGFCIDLSHFMAAKERATKEYNFIKSKEKYKRYFKANHINGYNYKTQKDVHTIKSLKDFDYLKRLPRFLFSKYIAIETFNSIEEQIKYRNYIYNLIKNKI